MAALPASLIDVIHSLTIYGVILHGYLATLAPFGKVLFAFDLLYYCHVYYITFSYETRGKPLGSRWLQSMV